MPLSASPKSPNRNPDRSREGPANDQVGGNQEQGAEKVRSSHPERSVSSTNKNLSRRTHHSSRPRSPISKKDTRISLTVAQIEEMIRKIVIERMAEMESKRAGTYNRSLDAEDGPLAPEIYEASMVNFHLPDLPKFRGSGDTQDPQTFVHGLRE